jgi:hypothetical protein
LAGGRQPLDSPEVGAVGTQQKIGGSDIVDAQLAGPVPDCRPAAPAQGSFGSRIHPLPDVIAGRAKGLDYHLLPEPGVVDERAGNRCGHRRPADVAEAHHRDSH